MKYLKLVIVLMLRCAGLAGVYISLRCAINVFGSSAIPYFVGGIGGTMFVFIGSYLSR